MTYKTEAITHLSSGWWISLSLLKLFQAIYTKTKMYLLTIWTQVCQGSLHLTEILFNESLIVGLVHQGLQAWQWIFLNWTFIIVDLYTRPSQNVRHKRPLESPHFALS